MAMKIFSFSELYEQLRDYLIANQDKITDLNENQGLDTQLKAIATLINQAYVKCGGGFKLQFEDIPYQVFQFPRKTAENASSTVVFSRVGDLTDPVDISAGSVVGTQGGLLYSTQTASQILAGNTSSPAIDIIAEDVGASYNVPVGSINVIVSSITGVNSVTNNTSASGGKDKESNSSYYDRFAKYIVGLSKCSNYGVYTIATQTTGVQSASVKEHFPPDSGVYNFTVYIDDGSGSVPQSLLDEVNLRIKGTGTADYPGGSAAGINLRVLEAGLVPIAVEMELDIDPVRGSEDDIEAAAILATQNYIDTASIGQDILPAELSKQIMTIPYVYNVNTLTLDGGTSTITISDSQVARTGSIAITFSTGNPR